jgi:hypothetical protein
MLVKEARRMRPSRSAEALDMLLAQPAASSTP